MIERAVVELDFEAVEEGGRYPMLSLRGRLDEGIAADKEHAGAAFNRRVGGSELKDNVDAESWEATLLSSLQIA